MTLQRDCGYVVLAMGKHGAFELNYSSDVDLIVLYDPDTAPLAEGVEPSLFCPVNQGHWSGFFRRWTKHGYVFRVDLRLRPDPRATQVAIAIEAAATYYENMGQNWERAAMIKARPCAGDMPLGEEFMSRLRPYIWRKYLDFAAIADVQSLKRQIHAVKGHGEIAVFGHNVKLGRGGIREIEFFVQTQQLIAGGRNPELRGRRTVDMSKQLARRRLDHTTPHQTSSGCLSGFAQTSNTGSRCSRTRKITVCRTGAAFENYARFAGRSGDGHFPKTSRHAAKPFKATIKLCSESGTWCGRRQPRLHRWRR